VLSHHPPLQSLELTTAETTKYDIRVFKFAPSPLLRDFKGPCELLRALSATEPLYKLRGVELPSLSTNRHDDPEDVMQAVISLGESATRLEMLQFWVTHLTKDLLDAVVCLCGNLKTLSISAVDQNADSPANPDAYTVQDLFSELKTLSLPSQIRVLSIELRTLTYQDGWAYEGLALKDYLVIKYPTLRRLVLTGACSLIWSYGVHK